MKKINKIFALILAALMIVGMVNAFADDPAYDTPLTVTGLETGDVAHFYKVIEWVDNATGNVKGWKAVSPFDSILTTAKLTEILVGTPDDPATTDVNEYVAPAGISAALAGQLAKLAKDLTGTDVDAASGTATLNNDAPGMWMALITPGDPDYVYNPIFVSADYNKEDAGTAAATTSLSYSDTAAAKKSKTELTKTASVTEDQSYADLKWTTTAIGEEVTFTVKTTIPAYKDVYEHPFFKLTDKLTDMKLVDGSITVSPATGATATPAADGKSYTVVWDEATLKTIAVPTEVTITYKAIVTTTAPVHVNTEKNEVSTEFSHNPSDESDHGFKKDTTQHYTFTLDASGLGSTTSQHGERTSEIVKVGVDANGNRITTTTTTSQISPAEKVEGPLAGATFKLYTDSACQHEYVPLKPDGTQGTPLELVSLADGRFTIKGLDAGTYYLREESAPAGFVKDGNAHKIEIIAETEEKTITEYTTDGVTWISEAEYNALADKTGYKSYTYKTDVLKSYTVKIDDQTTATYNFVNQGTDAQIDWTDHPPVEKPSEIVNTKGTELPSTGGMGTTIFYIVGSLLVLAAAILLVVKRRMNER